MSPYFLQNAEKPRKSDLENQTSTVWKVARGRRIEEKSESVIEGGGTEQKVLKGGTD